MDYTWMFYKDHENVNALLEFFEEAIQNEPGELIRQIEGELDANYVHEGNNQWGRSFVQESAIAGIIAGLEAVRSECVKSMERRAELRAEESVTASLSALQLGRSILKPEKG